MNSKTKRQKKAKELGLPEIVVYKISDLNLNSISDLKDSYAMEELLSNILTDDYNYCMYSYKYIINYEDPKKETKPIGVKIFDIDWDTEEF